MRFLILIAAAMLAACVSKSEPVPFAPNQVWRLADPPSPDARVVIDALETHGGQTVVRYAVVTMETGSISFDIPREGLESRSGEGTPVQVTTSVSSMFLEDGRWRPGTAVIKTEPGADASPGSLQMMSQISNLASYSAVLRPALARRPERDDAIQELFPNAEDRMSLMLPLLPEERELVLTKPLSTTLGEVAEWRERRFEQELTERPPPEPTPAVLPEADETPVEDADLDRECRARYERVRTFEPGSAFVEAQRALDERRAAAGLSPMPEFPELDLTISNITIMHSPTWGSVWRADWGVPEDAAQVRCWRPTPGAPPRTAISFDELLAGQSEAPDPASITP